jgi:hypothetical protein
MSDDPYSMSPQQAGAKLAEMSVEYSGAEVVDIAKTPEEATKKLQQLFSTPEWVNKLQAGSPSAHEEWQTLIQLKSQENTIDDIVNGTAVPPPFETVTEGNLSTRNLVLSAEWLREIGVPPEGVKHVIESLQPGATSKFTKEDVAWARSNRDRLMQTQEWVDRLLKGDGAARHALVALNAILVAGAAEDQK